MLSIHGKTNPLKINISLLFICVFMISWTALPLWPGYLASRHFDYVKAKVDNKGYAVRMLLFRNRLKKTTKRFACCLQ